MDARSTLNVGRASTEQLVLANVNPVIKHCKFRDRKTLFSKSISKKAREVR